MRHLSILALICLVTSPLLAVAAEEAEHPYTSKEQITFSPVTTLAFDRSGKTITHHKHADGSTSTEHNGSMANVTVARMGADGKVETYCTGDVLAAKAWLAGEFGTKPAVSPDVLPVVKQP